MPRRKRCACPTRVAHEDGCQRWSQNENGLCGFCFRGHNSLTFACLDSCDVEVERGLDCHECGHSLNCAFCCSNDDGPDVEAERAALVAAKGGLDG